MAASDHQRPSSELNGRVAIVTGGGAAADGIGNGRASALLLAESGASVVVVDRAVALGERTVNMIEAEGGTAIAVEADVTDGDACEAVVAEANRAFGRLDILVNNVGIGSQGDVVTESLDRWETVMKVNVTSMMLMSKYAIPAMLDTQSDGELGVGVDVGVGAGVGGAIVNVSSISALRPRGLTAYSTSKGAVIALSRAMAADHGRDGVRVNCVAPGPVRTPMVGGDNMEPEQAELRRRASALGIEGSGWDVGAAVRFLASDQARYITGQTLVVDGGVTIRGPGRSPQTEPEDH
ncbi:MAG: SDR family NAD(P)-dependent oxidoreductase [Acidimicrobiales bacterium]